MLVCANIGDVNFYHLVKITSARFQLWGDNLRLCKCHFSSYFFPPILASISNSYVEGNGNPLQCYCLENPRDSGAWWAAVCGVAQSQTRLKRLSSSSSSNSYLQLLGLKFFL